MIIDTFKSLRWVDFFFYAILEPRMLYKLIKENEPKHFALSFVIPAFVSFNFIVCLSLLSGGETTFFYYKITSLWILFLIGFLLNIIITSALIDLFGQFLGYKGNVREIISLINYSFVPFWFMVPIVSIFALLRFVPWIPWTFFMLAILFFAVWAAMIATQGIAEMHSLPIGKAALFYLFPFLLMGVITFFGLIITFFSLIFYAAG